MSSTKNYEKFKLLDCNREHLNDRHIGKLKTSIMNNGYLTANPIIVNKDYEILDGQHRFVACKQLSLPIVYEIIDDKKDSIDNDIIITLNNTQKRWTLSDYINYYATKYQKEDYVRLQAYCKSANASPSIVLAIAGSGLTHDLSNKAARGTLKFSETDEMRARAFYDRAKLIASALRLALSRRYVESLLALSKKEGFEWNTLIRKANQYPTKAYKCISKEDYLIMLRDLYNYNARSQASKIM